MRTAKDDAGRDKRRAVEAGSRRQRISYGPALILDEFANTPGAQTYGPDRHQAAGRGRKRGPRQAQSDAAEELRKIVATVGKRGEPGEHVRCVVSVSMLTEGWDANNVTHILGIRAFGSQLLCEQVVGRGLRRMDYSPTNRDASNREYVDVYGIPFSVIPFKGRPVKQKAEEDKPVNHVCALPERPKSWKCASRSSKATSLRSRRT